jgi:hypothetical protein
MTGGYLQRPAAESGGSRHAPIRVRIDRDLVDCDGLHEVLARLAWAAAGECVEVEADFEVPSRIVVPEALAEEVAESCGNLRFVRRPWIRLKETLNLVRDDAAKAAAGPGSFVASRYEAAEGGEMTRLVYFARRAEIESVRAASRRRLWQWREKWGNFTKAYLAATGPSFDRYKEVDDFEGAFVIACNSAVIDREFMEKARPSLVVFGDPIFHFGPSRYAAEFRERLRAAAREFDFRIAVTEKYCFLFAHCFPELVERTVFVPADGMRRDFHWRLDQEFVVKATKNILTLLMVPFGAAFARRLEILGCDGRKLADDGYFWGHSAAAQINDRMRNIQEAHPGFFRIDYNEYYLTHCRQLERFFLDLERSGVEVGSVSSSRIPALAKRSTKSEFAADLDIDTVNALLDDGARRVRTRLHQLDRGALTDLRFVSINPSLRGSMGHPLYQDLSIRKVISPDGSGFVSLGDGRLDESINGSFVLPVFETRIWQVHRWAGEQRRVAADAFVEELLASLEMLDASSRLDDAVLFLYLGHPALLPSLARRWGRKRFRCRRFVLNLFSGFFDGPAKGGGDGALRAVAQMADCLSGFEDLVLVCDSAPLANDFGRVAGMNLSLLPMCPSQSLVRTGDGRVCEEGVEPRKLRVVYPSQSEKFRGFEVLTRFLFLHAEEFSDTFEFVVRLQPVGKTKAFNRSNLTWVRGVLSEADYAELMTGADIILLPYSPEEFHYRTSSILAEAYSLGKPVVAISESWLGLQVSKTGCGWLADSWDAEGLREVFRRIASGEVRTMDPEAVARMLAWCEENRVERFVEAINQAAPVAFDGDTTMQLSEGVLFADAPQGAIDEFRVLLDKRVTSSRKKFKEMLPVGLRYGLEKRRIVFSRLVREGRRIAGRALVRLRGKRSGAGRRKVAFGPGGLLQGLPPQSRVRLDDMALCSRLARSVGDAGEDSIEVWRAETQGGLESKLGESGGKLPSSILVPREAFSEAGTIQTFADLLERAGYQVWVCQWHPEPLEAGGLPWFRIFPFPSLPAEVKIPTSLAGFRSPLKLAGVEKEVLRLLRED